MKRVGLVLALVGYFIVMPVAANGQVEVFEPPSVCFDWRCPIVSPHSNVAVEQYSVRAQVDDQVATTRITQVLRNDNDWVAEGFFYFPLPTGAGVTDLVLWIDGEPVEGELLSAEQARSTYQEIVWNLRDPALLEWIDRDLVRLSVFPIQPGDSRMIELEYVEVLSAEGGLVRYTHPLGSELMSPLPIEQMTLEVETTTSRPLRAVYSPSHLISVDRPDDGGFTAGFEGSNLDPDEDFVLYYSVADVGIGASVVSFKEAGEDGFYLMLLAPGVETEVDDVVAKDVLLVMDRSGSMDGEKFDQAMEAMRFILDHLGPDDRFNIITFSTDLDTYAAELQPASEAAGADRWLDRQFAAGNTDINRALLEAAAMTDQERPAYLVFLTDGLATSGETDPDRILANLSDAGAPNLSAFAFGVGYDVDTVLLDSLAADHHGTTSYVAPGEAIDEVVSGFYAKISTPVLTGVEIVVDGVTVKDTYPGQPSDVFAGEQLTIVGRYPEGGTADITLSGRVNGQAVTFSYDEIRFEERGGQDFLPRLWATRKIGALLADIRINGTNEEVIDQIVAISLRYGIVTPYTSFLVTEPLTGAVRDRLADEALSSGTFQLQRSGEAAVEFSSAAGDLASADLASSVAGAGGLVITAGSRAFQLVDGVWYDTAFDPDQQDPVPVAFGSEDYFALAAYRPDVAEALSIGDRVIVVVDDTPYEIVDADAEVGPVVLPEPITEETLTQPTPPPPIVNDPPAAAPAEPTETEDNGVPFVAWAIGGLFLTAGVIAWRHKGRHEHSGQLDSQDTAAEKELSEV